MIDSIESFYNNVNIPSDHKKLSFSSVTSTEDNSNKKGFGRWTREEHQRFLDGI